jgi:outer membrane protein
VNWIKVMGTATATLALAVCGNAALAQTRSTTGDGAKSAAPPSANGHADPAAASATKIAAINLRAAISNSAEGKQAAAQLDAQFAERRKEIEDLNKKIADLQQKLSAGSSVISDEERNKITAEGQKLTRQLDRRQQDFQEDFGDAQNEVVQRIGQRVVEVISKYAPSNGYVAVLDDSAQTTPVMYAATDITGEIIKLYDQTYPVKTSAATPATPDAKPAANATAKTATSKPTDQ